MEVNFSLPPSFRAAKICNSFSADYYMAQMENCLLNLVFAVMKIEMEFTDYYGLKW